MTGKRLIRDWRKLGKSELKFSVVSCVLWACLPQVGCGLWVQSFKVEKFYFNICGIGEKISEISGKSKLTLPD